MDVVQAGPKIPGVRQAADYSTPPPLGVEPLISGQLISPHLARPLYVEVLLG
jgi:hypothetical protein